MNVDLIFKIAAIGILVSILNIVLTKSGREEMAMMTTLAAVVVVLLMVAKEISYLFDTVKNYVWVLAYLYEIRCTYEAAKGEPIYGGRVNKGCSTRYSDSRFCNDYILKSSLKLAGYSSCLWRNGTGDSIWKAGAVIGAIEDAIDKAGIDARLRSQLKVTGHGIHPVFS